MINADYEVYMGCGGGGGCMKRIFRETLSLSLSLVIFSYIIFKSSSSSSGEDENCIYMGLSQHIVHPSINQFHEIIFNYVYFDFIQISIFFSLSIHFISFFLGEEIFLLLFFFCNNNNKINKIIVHCNYICFIYIYVVVVFVVIVIFHNIYLIYIYIFQIYSSEWIPLFLQSISLSLFAYILYLFGSERRKKSIQKIINEENMWVFIF